MSHRILLVGKGKMGSIHAGIFQKAIAAGVIDAEFAIVDTDPSRAEEARKITPHVYTDVEEALREFAPDIVDVVSPDDQHLINFEQISKAPSVKFVMTEKPLIMQIEGLLKAMEKLDAARGLLSKYPVSMDLIINFSGIWGSVEEKLAELGLKGVKPFRIVSRWGKDATKDTRPNSGVVGDDLVHPWGALPVHLGVRDVIVVGGYTEKGLRYEGEPEPHIYKALVRLASDDTTMDFEVNNAASSQQRTITAYFEHPEGGFYALCIEFDRPPNYTDSLKVYRYKDAQSAPELVGDEIVKGGKDVDAPEVLRENGKISAFIYKSWTAFLDYLKLDVSKRSSFDLSKRGLTDLNAAIEVQQIVTDLATSKKITRVDIGRKQATVTPYDLPALADKIEDLDSPLPPSAIKQGVYNLKPTLP